MTEQAGGPGREPGTSTTGPDQGTACALCDSPDVSPGRRVCERCSRAGLDGWSLRRRAALRLAPLESGARDPWQVAR